MNGPHSVSWKMKVKASSGLVEPIQVNLFGRKSTSGWNGRHSAPGAAVDAVRHDHEIRIGEEALVITRRLHSSSSTPSSSARSCRISSRVRREQPQKPLPPIRCSVPRKWMAMSSQ